MPTVSSFPIPISGNQAECARFLGWFLTQARLHLWGFSTEGCSRDVNFNLIFVGWECWKAEEGVADTALLQAWKHFRSVIQEKKIRPQRTQWELLSWKAESPGHPSCCWPQLCDEPWERESVSLSLDFPSAKLGCLDWMIYQVNSLCCKFRASSIFFSWFWRISMFFILFYSLLYLEEIISQVE